MKEKKEGVPEGYGRFPPKLILLIGAFPKHKLMHRREVIHVENEM